MELSGFMIRLIVRQENAAELLQTQERMGIRYGRINFKRKTMSISRPFPPLLPRVYDVTRRLERRLPSREDVR